MKQIIVNKTFAVKVPNSRMMAVQADFLRGVDVKCSIVGNTKWPDPEIKLIEDTVANIWFSSMIPITTKLDIVINQEKPKPAPKQYDPPEDPKSVKKLQYIRGEIVASQERVYPAFNFSKALTFDQSYYTRGVGQCKISADLEDKHGPHHTIYQLVSGAGFGSIQAAAAAAGFSAGRVLDFFTGSLRSSLRTGIMIRGAQAIAEIAAGVKFDRIGSKKTTKALQQFFKRPGTGIDLKVSDCKTEIFIPVVDANGRALAITKKTYPAMPLWMAVAVSVFDPLWFDTKPMIDGFSVLFGDVHKTNDILLAKNSPKMEITSIGSPVRIYDHGNFKMGREAMALRLNDQKHMLELRDAEIIKGRTRIQCTPIDEVKQFDFTDQAVDKAIKSGTVL